MILIDTIESVTPAEVCCSSSARTPGHTPSSQTISGLIGVELIAQAAALLPDDSEVGTRTAGVVVSIRDITLSQPELLPNQKLSVRVRPVARVENALTVAGIVTSEDRTVLSGEVTLALRSGPRSVGEAG